MKRIASALAACLLIFSIPCMAHAAEYGPAYQRLAEFNRTQPLQNPEFTPAADVLAYRILDRKNRVVGEVRDILLNANGNVSEVQAEFDRLHLAAPVTLNYRAMRMQPVTKGYALELGEEELAELYPQLLADTQTAAGEDDEILSVRRLIGAPVKDDGGRSLGTVEEVLFNATGTRAEGYYVALNQGALSGRHVAVPYNAGRFSDSGSRSVTVDAAQADAMIALAGNQ